VRGHPDLPSTITDSEAESGSGCGASLSHSKRDNVHGQASPSAERLSLFSNIPREEGGAQPPVERAIKGWPGEIGATRDR